MLYKTIITSVIISLLSFSTVFSQEFSPIVKITALKQNMRAECSGVTIGEDDKNYYILSCNHIFEAISNPTYLVSSVYSDNGEIVSVDIKCKLVKAKYDCDLSHFSMSKNNIIKLTPMKLADSRLLINSQAEAYGFPFDSFVMEKYKITVDSYDSHKLESGVCILHSNNKVKSGMSGGPLIANNEIHGILSTGGENSANFIPAFECINFLKK